MPIGTYPCHFEGGNQLFLYSRFHEIRHEVSESFCLTADDMRKSGPSVNLRYCQSDFHRNRTAPGGINYHDEFQPNSIFMVYEHYLVDQ